MEIENWKIGTSEITLICTAQHGRYIAGNREFIDERYLQAIARRHAKSYNLPH